MARKTTDSREYLLNERSGRFRGVGLGSSDARARRKLGVTRMSANEPLAPLGRNPAELGFPPSPKDPRRIRGSYRAWRFTGVAFGAFGRRAYLMTVASGAARTTRGITVGDPLRRVQKRYPELKCRKAGGQGSEYVQVSSCTGKVAPRRYVWFGRDPVHSITVSAAPLE